MSERSIQKLKKRFIMISMITLVTTMLMIAGLLYLGNIAISRQVIRATLDYIVESNGELVAWEEFSSKEESKNFNKDNKGYDKLIDNVFMTTSGYKSPEFEFMTRYFAVFYGEDNLPYKINTVHIADISEDKALEYSNKALQKKLRFGRFDKYYYRKAACDDGTTIVVFMDCSNLVHVNDRLFYLALMLIGFGMIVAFVIVKIFSGRAIRSEVKNAELQKQFMTNASHELKTPLAVISANTEMIEMFAGESEWTESNKRQIERMNGLIQNLVMITRADENHLCDVVEKVDVTRAISETTKTFMPVAIQNGKKMSEKIDENVSMHADEAGLRQLCSLLVDNAIKYCDADGEIEVSLSQKGRGIVLAVANSYAEGEFVDYTKFFERFYRHDESHNLDKGGYGIGLSIAESLAKQYKGKIDVSWKKGQIKFTCNLKGI